MPRVTDAMTDTELEAKHFCEFVDAEEIGRDNSTSTHGNHLKCGIWCLRFRIHRRIHHKMP